MNARQTTNKTSFATTLDQLANPNRPFKRAELNGLSNGRRADIQLFAERWPTIPVERRREIMRGMSELVDENFEVEFTRLSRLALEDPDADVRAAAINSLWESDDTDLIEPYLRFMTQDPSSQVRAAAAKALGQYMYLGEMEELDEGVAARIRQALLTTARKPIEEVEVRRMAVESLGYASDDETRIVIEDAYNAASEKMQASALLAMGRSLDLYWSGAVLTELGNPNPDIRLEAVRASGELELKQAVPGLIDLLDDPNREILLDTIHALGQIGGPGAREALEMMSENEDEEIVQAAEDALAELDYATGADWLVYDFNAGGSEEGAVPDGFELPDEDDAADLDDALHTLWQRQTRDFND